MMDVGEQISRLENRLRGWVAERVAAIVQWSPIGSTDAKRGGYRLDGRPTSQRYSRAARSVQHAGFQSRPLANTNGVVLSVEGGPAKAVVVAEDDGYDANLDEGEVILYAPGKPTAHVKIDKDGAITATNASGASVQITKDGAITLTTATGQLFTANGSTDFEVRGTTYRSAEDTMLTALTTLFTAIGAFATAIGPAGGAPGIAAATTLNTAITTAIAAVTTFKGGAANYLSTKNKIG